MIIDISFWKKASTKRKRIYSLIFIFIISVIVTLAGSLVPLSTNDAQMLYDQVNKPITENKGLGSLSLYIFRNNFLLCLVMFIPIVGVAFGLFILFSTGIALGAIATIQGIPVILDFLILLITPIFWIEFVSYSLAMTASIWLSRRLLQKRWRELKWTGISIAITALLLVIGAVFEAWLIIAAGVTAP
jgi:uncharacterized membrane protein SpoIIM required for sporulation